VPRVELHVDDATLGGTMFPPRGGANDRHPALIFAHGWGASQKAELARARRLADRGFVTLAFTFRGHGRHRRDRETVTRIENLLDLLAAYDFIASRPEVDPSAIGLVGASYGGYLAAITTGLRRVAWLALQAPAIYRDEGFDRPKRSLNRDPSLAAYRLSEIQSDRNLALQACSLFTGAVLVAESEHDTVVPAPVIANYIRSFGRARSLTHLFLRDATHSLEPPAALAQYDDSLARWITETSSAPPVIRAGGPLASRIRRRTAPW
jgi:hypothetical protein